MNQNPYQSPNSNPVPTLWPAKSTLIAGVTGVVIWLTAIGVFWFYYEPTFSNGELFIQKSGQSADDPFLSYYMEIRIPIWEAAALAALLLLVILSGTFGIAWLYQRRRTA